MTRKFKALGVGLFAVLALAAFASTASAHKFTSTSEKTVITGAGESERSAKFRSNGTESTPVVECNSTYEGTVEGKSVASITVTPTFSNCASISGQAVTVATNHCAFILNGATATNSLGTHASAQIECAAGSGIEVKIGAACTLKFVEQTPTPGGAVYTATTGASGKGEITVNATVHGVAYTKAGPLCSIVPGNGTNGTYVDQVTTKGFADEKSIGSGTEVTTPVMTGTEGAQVNIGLEP